MAEDHRVRVAREKRERMRAHLLLSVLAVCSKETARGPAVIDDVTRHAEVSRGTFYKYFESLDQAIGELGLQFADDMVSEIGSVYDTIDDPVMRTATGFQMYLIRSVIEPHWGAFIANVHLLSGSNLFTSAIQADIRAGLATGDYDMPSVEVATDLLMGAKVEAIRRIIADQRGAEYVRMSTAMVLRSFGVSRNKAEVSVRRAAERLEIEAPGTVDWWRRID